ncbi:MAG: hypothetical protein AAF411_03865 [Myxococcota bacterium]
MSSATRSRMHALASVLFALAGCADVRIVGELAAEDSVRVVPGADARVIGSALDDDGNLYIVGRFSGELGVDEALLRAPENGAAFVMSFSPDGDHRWSQAWFSTNFAVASDVWVVGERVLVAGHVSGSTDAPIPFDAGRRQSAVTFVFSRRDGTPIEATFVARSASGNVQTKAIVEREGREVLVGHYVGQTDLGGGALPRTPVNVDNAFVAFFANGSHRWSTAIEGANVQLERAVLGPTDVVVAGGWFNRGALFGSADARGRDAFMVRVNEGGVQRAWVFASDGDDEVGGVAIRSEGGEVVVGFSEGELSVGDRRFAGLGGMDGFVLAIDEAGAVEWARMLGSSANDQVSGVAIDRDDGTVIVAGTFEGTLAFADETFEALGEADVFLAAFGPSGEELWARRFGGAGPDSVGGLELAPDEVVLGLSIDGEVPGAEGITSGPISVVRVAR